MQPSTSPREDGYDPEAFPTRHQLLHALLMAGFLSFSGFVLSYLLFVKHSVLISISPIDRRGAEGAPPIAYVAQNPQGKNWSGGDGYVASSFRPTTREHRADLELHVPKMTQPLAAPTAAAPTSTPTPLAQSLALPGEAYPDRPGAAARHPNTIHAPATAASTANATTPSPARPAVRSWGEAWATGRLAMVQLATVEGPICAGAIVDKSGLVIACASKTPSDAYGRVMLTGGGVFTVTEVNRDPDNDLVLLRLPAGDYPALALAPDGPGSGEALIGPTGSDPSQYAEARAAGVTGGQFFYHGVVQNSSAGSALINARGELVGLSLGKPLAFSASSVSLAVRASSVQALMARGTAKSSGSSRGGDEILGQALAQRISAIENRDRPTQSNARIVPGEGIGNYPLGMTRALLDRELGAGTPGREGGGFSEVSYPTPHLLCTFTHNRVVSIETDYGFYTTANGMAPGAVFDINRVRGLVSDAVTGSLGGRALAAGSGLEIESRDNKITVMRVVPR